MANEFFFFATKNDLHRIMQNIELQINLKYVNCGSYESKELPILKSISEYPFLGINRSGDHQSESLLVMNADDNIYITERNAKTYTGKLKYSISQQGNENSIILWPGGIHKDNFLICGHVGTIHKSKISQELFTLFKKEFIKQCKRYGRYVVGKETIQLYGKIRFITININQSREYDFIVPDNFK